MTLKRRSPSRPQTREHLLSCAKKIFAEKGYHLASIADIIQEARVARGTFYLHFESKREIFGLLLDQLMEQIDSRIKRIELAPGKPSFMLQLKSNISGALSLLLADAALVRIMLFKSVGQDPDFDEKLDSFYENVTMKIALSLRTGIGMGLIRECETQVVAVALLGQVKEILGWLVTQKNPSSRMDRVIDELLSLGLFGLFPSLNLLKR